MKIETLIALTLLTFAGCTKPVPASTCTVVYGLSGATGPVGAYLFGTKKVTAIHDAEGNSITRDPNGSVTVGQPAPYVLKWNLAGAVVGPSAGYCTAPITAHFTDFERTRRVTYTVDATAVWPETKP